MKVIGRMVLISSDGRTQKYIVPPEWGVRKVIETLVKPNEEPGCFNLTIKMSEALMWHENSIDEEDE